MTQSSNPSRPGLQAGGSDNSALLLKVYSGEVLQQFEETNVMRSRVTMRSIPFGKSAQFPVMGKAYAVVHSPGVNILDATNTTKPSTDPTGSSVAHVQQFSHNERIIYVDQKLISASLVSDIDEVMNHYDVRGKYASEQGRAVSYVFDKCAIFTLIQAARVASNNAQLVSGEPGGGTDGNAGRLAVGSTPTGQAIADACFSAAQRFDEIDVPKQGRTFVMSPQMAYACIKDPTIYAALQTSATQMQVQRINALSTAITTQGSGIGAPGGLIGFGNPNLMFGNASWSAGSIGSIAGIEIVVSNHIPSTDLSASSSNFWASLPNGSNANTYRANYSLNGGTKGVIFHESAVGGLQVRDLSVESQWYPEYQGTLLLTKLITGFNWLRPSSAIEVTGT